LIDFVSSKKGDYRLISSEGYLYVDKGQKYYLVIY